MKRILLYISFILIIFSACKKDDVIKSVVVKNLDNYSIASLAFDLTNSLWIATDTGLFKAITSGYEMFDIGVSGSVTALVFDKNLNSLWIGTTDGLYQLNLGSSDSIVVPVALDKLSNSKIWSAYVDENEVKWFGTETGFTRNQENKWQNGLFKMNVAGAVTSLQFDDFAINSIGMWDGDYYFGTAGNKLWRTTGWKTSVDAFTGATMWDSPYNGFAIADTMYAVFIDSKGQQWFGGREGVQVHIGHDPKEGNTSYYDELVNPVVRCIAEDSKGNIWVGTENGISIFDGENWNTSTIKLPNNFVTAIAFNVNGSGWIGTQKGIVKID